MQPIQQAIVLGVTLVVLILLFFEKFRPAVIFFVAVLVFLLAGIVETKDFSSAIANESVLSIFLLIFITTGIHDHFNIIGWLDKLFGKTSNPRSFMVRMTAGVTAISAFMNNTPLVAMMMPYVDQWLNETTRLGVATNPFVVRCDKRRNDQRRDRPD